MRMEKITKVYGYLTIYTHKQETNTTLHNCLLTNSRTVVIKIKRENFILNLKMMQEASKRRCNKIKLLLLSFVSKLISQKILIHQIV